MLKREEKILQAILKENGVYSPTWCKELFTAKDFCLAINSYRYLGSGTVPKELKDVANLVNHTFIDTKMKQTVTINPKECLTSIRAILKEHGFTLRNNIKITIECNTDRLSIVTALSETKSRIVLYEVLKPDFKGSEPVKIHCRLKYFTEAMDFMNNTKVTLGFTSKVSPIAISEEGNFGSVYQKKFGVILPIRVFKD